MSRRSSADRRNNMRSSSQRLPGTTARGSAPARKRTWRRTSSMASPARCITWNESCTIVRGREIVTHGVAERLGHVHRAQLNLPLPRGAQRAEQACKRLLSASFAERYSLPRSEVAHDGDELLLALVAPHEVLFVDAELNATWSAAESSPSVRSRRPDTNERSTSPSRAALPRERWASTSSEQRRAAEGGASDAAGGRPRRSTRALFGRFAELSVP